MKTNSTHTLLAFSFLALVNLKSIELNRRSVQTSRISGMNPFFQKCGVFAVTFLIANLFLAIQTFGQSQTFTTVGNNSFIVPAGVTSVTVEAWGAGGAGGGNASSNGTGGGGGGGAYVKALNVSVIPGNTYTITVGAGGVPSVSAGLGGLSRAVLGSTVTAPGGNGGTFATAGVGGAGGIGTFNGGTGSNGNSGTNFGGAGAGGAGTAANGASPVNTQTASAAVTGGGAGGNGASGSNGDGSAGNAPGGGGGGCRAGGTTRTGGLGGNGKVVISWVACTPPAAPGVTTPVNLCQNTTASPLTASGISLLWYTTLTGGTGSSIAPTPSTTSLGTTSYYVSQTIGCEGPRSKIDVTVNALPVTSIDSKSDITCFSGNDGSITISVPGGSGQYSYSVDGGTTFTAPESNPYTFGGLKANTAYQIKVKDSKGCISK